MTCKCQLCGASNFDWTIRTAEVNVGELQYYKIRLCALCTKELETAITTVFEKRVKR